jgi:hypothetical protein
MMFEPLSVLSIVGTTAGLLSFIANTIDKLNERRGDFKDCQKLLAEYSCRQQTAEQKLKSWVRLWCDYLGKPFLDQTYISALSQTGYQGIMTRLELIGGLNKEIEELLYFGKKPAENDVTLNRIKSCHWSPTGLPEDLGTIAPDTHLQDEWVKVLRMAAESRNQDQRLRPAPWMETFCFALYKNTTLKDRICRLEKMVDDLCVYSREMFCASYDPGNSRNPLDMEITSLNEQLSRKFGLSNFLASLHQTCKENMQPDLPEHVWALLLGVPKVQDGAEYLRGEKDLHLEFLIETRSPQRGWMAHIVRIDVPGHGGGRELLRSWVRNWNSGVEATLSPHWKTESLKETLRRIHVSGPGMRTAGALIRVMTAADIVASTLMFYDSPWISGLCTCAVHYTCSDESYAPTFRAVPQHSCFDIVASSRGFLLLTVALAELALAAPVYLSNVERELRFKVDDEHLNRQELLEMVRKSWGVKIKRAMEHCLDLDYRLLHRQLNPEDIRKCLENVAKP